MKTFRTILVAASLFTAEALLGADIKIIANPSVGATSISADELKAVYLLMKSSLGDGSRVEPTLEKGGATHALFTKTYLGKSESSLDTYYSGLVFTGKASLPKSVAGDADFIAWVAKTKGAIGYVSADAPASGDVKVLELK